MSCTNVAKQSEQLSVLIAFSIPKKAQSTADAESVWYPLKSTKKISEESTSLLNLCTTPWKWGVATPPLGSRRRCQKLQETRVTSVARRWPHEAPYRNTQTYLGWSLEYCPFLDHLKTIQITCNATQGERLRYRNDFMLQWENPTNPGIMSIHEKFRDAVKTTYNDGSSRTRVHLHPSTGKDLTTSHWLATTLSTPRRVQTMESCPWNSGAIVIVFVNDLVEFATLGKSSTVAKVANEPQLGKSQLCQTRGQDSGNSRYWVRNLFQGFCGAWQGSKQQPDQIICDLRFGLACRKQSKTKKSKNALSRRQKLDNASKLTEKLHRSRRRRIWRISQNEARKKLETPLEPPLPCKMATRKRVRSYGKLCSRIYKEAFGIYSSEKSRRSHRREREFNSLTHYNVVHKFVPVLQAMKILDAKAAVNKEWEKLEKIPAWQMDKVKSKKDVILLSTRSEKESPLCCIDGHLSFQELPNKKQKHQKYKRTSRAPRRQWKMILMHTQYSQNKDRQPSKWLCKSHGCYCEITRMCWTSRWRSNSSHPGKNGGRSTVAEHFKVRMCPKNVDTSSTTQVAQIMVTRGRPSLSSWTKFCTHTHLLVSCGKDGSRKFCWDLDGTKFRTGNVFLVNEDKGLFLSVFVGDFEMAGRQQNMAPLSKKLMELADLDEPHHFLIMCTSERRQCQST